MSAESYKADSNWNDKNEMRCLLIFKKLETEKFPRGRQMQLCREISQRLKKSEFLSEDNISAKVCNYKSVAGVNNDSNYSTNTEAIYKKFEKFSILKLEREIEKMD